MHRLLLITTALLTAGLRAQDPQFSANAPTNPVGGLAITPLRSPIHTAEGDLGHSYGLWAAGDSYKVSFAAGATFVPYLGREYPHNQPFGWQTKSIRVGAQDLTGTTAQADASDYRYEVRRGQVTEAYDVLVDGLEQTFVLHSRPETAGELVIRGAIATMLQAKNQGGGHQPITFVDAEGNDVMTYGAATAIDRLGRRMPMSSRVEGSEVVLTLSGDWLATAEFPVVVDPLLTRVFIVSGNAVDSIDIGRDDQGSSANVMIAYERAASISDGDLYVRRMGDDFSTPQLVWEDITTSWDSSNVRCAYVGGPLKWAVVFGRRFPSPVVLTQLRCHVRASSDMVFSTTYGSLVPPTNQNDWRADVGGSEAFVAGSKALVVFQREENSGTSGNFANTPESSVFASLLDVTTANGTFGTAFAVLTGASFDFERPAVNQVAEGGAAYSWMMCCQTFNNSIAGDDWDVHGKKINHLGVVAPGILQGDIASAGMHQLAPIVEGYNGRYLVAFTAVDTITVPGKTSSVAGKEVRAMRFDWLHGDQAPAGTKPSVILRQNNDRRWEVTGLAADTESRSHWTVGYRTVLTTPGTFFGAHVTRVGYNGRATESQVLQYGTTALGHVACTFDNDNDAVLCAYDSPGTSNTIYGHAFTNPTAPASTNSGTACSNTQLLWNGGSQQIGSELCGPRAIGAPATALHAVIVALATTSVNVVDPAVFPGCYLLVAANGPSYLGLFPLAVGSDVSWQLSLPEFLSPMTLHFQDWQFVPASNLFHSSHRLTVPLVK